jgi:Ca2+-transporting ATPase
MGLTVFSLANIWFALETSDPQHSVFSMDLRDNPTLLKGVGLAILATIAAVELNILNRLLDTVGLTTEQWIICVVVSLAVLAVGEVVKLLRISTEETMEVKRVATAQA